MRAHLDIGIMEGCFDADVASGDESDRWVCELKLVDLCIAMAELSFIQMRLTSL